MEFDCRIIKRFRASAVDIVGDVVPIRTPVSNWTSFERLLFHFRR